MHKWKSYDVWFLIYGVWQTKFFLTVDNFLPFYSPSNPENHNFEKNEKNKLRYYHFIHVHHKWKSYDVCFLRYKAWQTDFFVVLDHFLPFYPTNNPKKSKFWKNEIQTWRYHHFKQEYQKLWSYAIPFLIHGTWWM